jgi:iron complex outermembrane receptor protein
MSDSDSRSASAPIDANKGTPLVALTAHFRKTTALVGGLAPLLLGFTTPALAQDTTAAAPAKEDQAIIVTGTLFKRKDLETPSPVTRLTTDDLEKRGIQTVQAAIQTISSNNGPALTNGFTANGAFAAGASAVSLRGLTTDSTLVLIDGMRTAYYPLADDGTRNFVDLNSIPDEIVDHIDVLKDGASSTYGADAVAGVVNIITKKTIVGFHGTAEAGVAERGYGGNRRFTAAYGYGDLNDQGFNAYITAHYVASDTVTYTDLPSPYNTGDQSSLCYKGNCGTNFNPNGVNSDGTFNGLSTATDIFLVRPYNATNSAPVLDADGNDRYQLLNPALGCQGSTPYTLTADQYATFTTAPHTVCQQTINDLSDTTVEPRDSRWGVAGHFIAHLGNNAEFHLAANYERHSTFYTGLQSIIRGNAAAGIDFPAYSTSTAGVYGNTVLALPVYICPRGTVTCTAANGTLNPNNPFAAQGDVARIIGRLPDSQESNATLNQVYRVAAGIDGNFLDTWHYSVDFTGAISRLKTTSKGDVYIQHLLDEIADGSYNFVNPNLNTKATLDYLSPTQVLHDTSHLYQGQANISHDFFDLPGGAFSVAVGGAVRYESLNDPSGNPDYNGPTERYIRANAFGAAGHRYVESGYFEADLPVLKILDINASGRYDHYSTGQSNFSPKIGAKFNPIRQITFTGTFSKGFRIPSFAESGALPTTGYVTQSLGALPADFVAAHSTGGVADDYVTNYSIGETTVGNPKLKAEKSTNYTFGGIVKPINNVSLRIDYYNIKKTHAITTVDFSGAIANYYATGGLSYNGVTIIQDEADPDHTAAQKRIAFVQGSFINANTIKTSGVDAQLAASYQLTDHIKFTTSGEATYIIKLNTTFPDGSTEKYAGTLGNFNLTAGSGTPRWKANWQNTLDFGKWSLTATAYYTSGYNYSAEDQTGPGTAGDCALVPTNQNGDQYQPCNVKGVVFVDLHGEIKVGDKFTLYGDILNVADRKAPIDATTYGSYLFNPVVGDEGIIGRSFRVGAKVDL